MAVTKYPVVWQAEATKNLAAILKYLEENWTQKEIQQFFRKLEHIVSLLATYPKLFQETQARKNVRRCVVSSQTTLYYISTDSVWKSSSFLIQDKIRTS